MPKEKSDRSKLLDLTDDAHFFPRSSGSIPQNNVLLNRSTQSLLPRLPRLPSPAPYRSSLLLSQT
jgi:hypothetical protein